MSETPLRSKMRAGAAASTKRKRSDVSSASSGDNGDTDISAEDANESVEASEEEDDDDDEVIIRRRTSLRQKNKMRKVAKKATKSKASKRAAVEEESDDESSSSSSPERGLKVERHSKIVRRAKNELKEERKRLAAKGRKFTIALDVSDSSTEGDADPPSITLAAKKGEAFEEGRNRAGRRVARAMNKSVLDRDREHPPGTAKQFKSLIPKPQYDEYWTEAQQMELEQRLEGDEDFKKQLNVSSFVVSIWKTAYRFTGRLATDIIGPRTGLEFKSDSGKGDGLAWTQRSCETLASIILHPLFNLDTEKMALALQWAVICRTGDRRKYRLSGCDDELFLQGLVSIVDKHQDGSKTACQLREAATYEYMKARGRIAGPPVWSQFLARIEKKALQYSEGDGSADDVEEGPYLVNITDLYVVRSALDRLKHLSLRQFADSRQVVDAVMPTRTKWDVPTSELTQRAIKAVLLYKERNKERLRLRGPPEVLPSPALNLEAPS